MTKEVQVAVERIIWVVIGLAFVVWAGIIFFTDSLSMEQKDMDALQNLLIGALALGMAVRTPYYERRDRL